MFDGEFYLNKSRNIFFTARLIETGMVKDFLETAPNANEYSLYSTKDNLPEKAWQFLWNADSPLYNENCIEDGGWSNCWKIHSSEYGKMIQDILTTPRLLGKFIHISLVDWGMQLLDFNTGPLISQGKDTAFDDFIPHYFDDSVFYRKSKQYQETLTFDAESKIQRWAVGISMILIILVLAIFILKRNENSRKIGVIFSLVLFGLLINAFICSVFSGVLNRYQGRVIWLVPFLACLLIAKYIEIQRIPKSKT